MTDKLTIAIDLGGTQVRAALVDAHGVVKERLSERTQADTNGDVVTSQIATLARKLIEQAGRGNILGAGASSPGPIDTATGYTLGLPSIAGFENFPLREVLAEKIGIDVKLENDGIAAAIAEWQLGAGKGLANVVYVTVSTGVGGGVIVDNHVLRGRRGMAAHVGHMSIVPNGEICGCGNAGCLEAYASATNFTKRANRAGIAGDAAAVFTSAKAGNRLAQDLVHQQALYLAQGFVSIMHVFSPDILIIGGGMSQQFDVLIGPISEYVNRYAMKPFQGVRIVKAALGGDSGLIGASRLVYIG